jgi:hypothetical protein
MTIKCKSLLFLLPLSMVLAQCHTAKKTAETNPTPTVQGPELPPPPKPSVLYVPTEANVSGTTTLEQLTQGRKLVEIKCTNCHRLYPASRYSADRWVSIVKNMQRRAETTDEKISDADSELILKYLSAEKI